MSWLKRLFGNSANSPTNPTTPSPVTTPVLGTRVSIENTGSLIITVPELDMIGQCISSPNKRYTMVWQDRGWNHDRSDPRGRYVLLDDGVVVVDGRMDRPQHGKVANDGTFILNDWHLSSALSGTFYAFKPDGTLILRRDYTANLYNNGLSNDGALAVCQTANSPGSPDSSILTVFDLAAGASIASWRAEFGWADSYEFPDGGTRIRMLRRDRQALHYTLDGQFPDRQLWLQDEVRHGNVYMIRQALGEGEAATGLSLDHLRAGIKQALAGDDQRYVADTWRLLGEIEESVGDIAAAVKAYDKALTANPKIGISRKTAALRKTLNP